jgi:hypothetical protein
MDSTVSTSISPKEMAKFATLLRDPSFGAALLQNPIIQALLPPANCATESSSENPKKWVRKDALKLLEVRRRVREELTSGDPHLANKLWITAQVLYTVNLL